MKIVVFDAGFGGDLFADYVEEELPTIDVIRVIDWRAQKALLSDPKTARVEAERALLPYIGKVDLIFFSHHLLSMTSIKYFRTKYPNQAFAGMTFYPSPHYGEKVLLLSTSAQEKSLTYRLKIRQLGSKVKTFSKDDWFQLIDDGDLTSAEIRKELIPLSEKFAPDRIVITCSNYVDIKPELRKIFGQHVSIEDCFKSGLYKITECLKIKGRAGMKRKQ